jgi:hypothetical protein
VRGPWSSVFGDQLCNPLSCCVTFTVLYCSVVAEERMWCGAPGQGSSPLSQVRAHTAVKQHKIQFALGLLCMFFNAVDLVVLVYKCPCKLGTPTKRHNITVN